MWALHCRFPILQSFPSGLQYVRKYLSQAEELAATGSWDLGEEKRIKKRKTQNSSYLPCQQDLANALLIR